MYVDRHARPKGVKPGSLAIAIALNAAMLAALLFSSPTVREKLPHKPLVTDNILIDPPPDPIPPEAKPQPQQKTAPVREEIESATKIIAVAKTPYVAPTQPLTGPAIGTPTGTMIIPVPLSRS